MTEQQTAEPIFSIEKIYTRDISLESPNAPQIFLERENPTVEMQLRNEASNLEEGLYDVLLTVTVTAKVGDKTMFLAEAGQAGIFHNPQSAGRQPRTGAGRDLPEHPVPLCA